MVEQAYVNKQNQMQQKTAVGPAKKKPAGSSSPQFESRVKQLEQDPIQAAAACCGEVNRLAQSMEPVQRQEDEDLMQGKFAAQRQEDEDLMQGKFAAQRQEDEDLMQGKFQQPVQRQPKGNSGVSDGVMSQMENAFQADFSDVKVHPNSSKAPDVGAVAYTQGSDIHFAPGQFKPDTSQGRQLLGHELTHVVQQREGKVQPTTEVNGLPVNDDLSFEKEADDMGKKVNNL